jgi:hypothetical protein
MHPSTNQINPALVTLGTVARELDIAQSTAWARTSRGDIPAQFVCGRFLVERPVLDRLVREKAEREAAADSSRAFA